MATGEDETDPATVVDASAPGAGEATVVIASAPYPTLTRPAPSPRELASLAAQSIIPSGPATTITTAADAMRDEEIARTRLLIRMGWALSVATIGVVPFLGAPRAMGIAFIAATVVGIVVSIGFHQAFADPRRYTPRSLLVIALMCVINAHVAVLYFGAFTVVPVIVVIGIHFGARTEAEQIARWIYLTAMFCYTVIAAALIVGVLDDAGVYASEADLAWTTQLIGAGFVLGTYTLAYVTARAVRRISLDSIETLQRATRLASQREALMDELRADLERALRVGGPGRHTDHVVGGFKLGVVLGRGAMGEVYEAIHVETDQPAAVKLLRRELLTDPTQVARFLREVRASGALASPHVVKILDAAPPDATLPYLAMERLHGETLAALLRETLRLAPAEVATLVRQVGAGIDAAGAAGIVHRDLKPQNLLREAGGVTIWKILDFGVATLSEESSGTLTQGGIVGTPSYMSPEQAQGKRVDSRSDVYAVAAVAYRALTGRHPFNAPDTPALLYAVVHKMPARPGELVDLHPDVDRWFVLALAKVADERFATGAALALTFTAALAGELEPRLRKRADAMLRKHPWD